MLILLSPSKTLDFKAPPAIQASTQPALLKDAQQLIATLREFPKAQLGNLMGVSEKLAAQVFDYVRDWEDKQPPGRGKQAVFAYQGDVYAGLDAQSLSAADLGFAQDHLRILSGLYGILRPLDVIQPYRLEMATPLKTSRGKSLYEYWGNRINKAIQADLDAQPDRVIVNLASSEYTSAIEPGKLAARVISPTFKDKKDGKYRFMQFFGKKARGQMARYIVERRLKKPDSLKKSYNVDGYQFNTELSSDDDWVFTREAP
jgi:cytoplasmic iron level regulating protein YaaA (DUF328/UPF0246 family)